MKLGSRVSSWLRRCTVEIWVIVAMVSVVSVAAANNFVSLRDGAGNPAVIVADPSDPLGMRNWDGTLLGGKTLKFATIATSSSGATAIVAAVTGKKIKVIGVWLSSNGTVNVKWQSASTDITGLAYLLQGNGYVLPTGSPGVAHWFETASGEALNINLSATVAVGGSIVYYEE